MTIPSSILFLLIGGAVISIIGALIKSYFKQIYESIEELKQQMVERHGENRIDIDKIEERMQIISDQVQNIMGRLGRTRGD